MPRIVEKIIEPSRIEVGSIFKIKVKVEDEIIGKRLLITEDSTKIITEDEKTIRTEWGE